jgi:hypothetical protein
VDNITGGGTGGQRGERATGTSNTIYNLSSVLFHALKGGASYDTYIEDAEREGDEELAEFFRRVRDEDSMRADEAQMLLAERTPTTTTTTSTTIEPVEGPTAPSTGLASGAPRREETAGRVEGRPDTDIAPTDPAIGAGRGEPDVSPTIQEEAPPPRTTGIEEGTLPRREEAATAGDVPLREEPAPPGREGASRQPEREREEDKGFLERARDALLGEEGEPRRRGEGTDRPEERR